MQNAGSTYNVNGHRAAEGPAGGWDRVSSVSMFELIVLLWRQLPIMSIVFIVIFALGMLGAMSLKKSYTAQGRILVQYGEEYIYNPIIGTAGQGTAYTADQMIQAEVGFFSAVILKERVLEKLGMRKIYPELALEYGGSQAVKNRTVGKALQEFSKNLGAFTAPNQPLISVSYRNGNPEVAAEVLNAVINEYLAYRREVLLDAGNAQYGNERISTEVKLQSINEELERFLSENEIGDFVAERTAAGVRLASLNDQLLTAKARRREIDAGIRAREDRLAIVPEEIVQYTDDASSAQLATTRIEREQLLAKYTPNSKPVQALDAQIERLEAFIADGKNKDVGTIRTGVNLVHQTLQSEKLTLESEAQSIAEKISVLTAQIGQVKAKQLKMQKLFPQYQKIANKADVLQTAVKQFSTREEEYQARRNLAEEASNNIRVIERPVIPFEGKSLKKPAAILAFLFAGFTALVLGLMIVFLGLAKGGRLGLEPRAYQPKEGPNPEYPGGGGFGRRSSVQRPATHAANVSNMHPSMAMGTGTQTAYGGRGRPFVAHNDHQQLHPNPYYSEPTKPSAGYPVMPVASQHAGFGPGPGPGSGAGHGPGTGLGPGGLPILANIGPKTGRNR